MIFIVENVRGSCTWKLNCMGGYGYYYILVLFIFFLFQLFIFGWFMST